MLKILICTSDKSTSSSINQTFKDIGYETFISSNPKEGLSLIKKEKPSAVFLDIAVTGVNSFDFIKEIHAFDKKILIIIISSVADKNAIAKAFELGAIEFLNKPFSREQLRNIISKNIHKVRLHENTAVIPRLLICEDDSDVNITLKRMILRRFVSDVDIASDGFKAIELFKEKTYDIILMDIGLPGINGIDTINEILKINSNVKIIVISAYRSLDVASKAIKADAVDFIMKPVEINILEARLENILKDMKKLMKKDL